MRRKLCWIGLAATLVLGLVPAAASAENYRFQFRGSSAYASFWDTDTTGCISTYASVSLYENRFKEQPGPPQEEPALDVYIYRYDYCQDIYHFYASGHATLSPDAFSLSNSLQSASVTATVDVFDWITGEQSSVSVDLDWTGVGETFHGSSRYQTITPHYKYISRSSGSSRDAQVAGTILMGATNLAVGTSWASLNSNQSGTLAVWR